MKYFIIFLIFTLFVQIHSQIPNWELSSQSIDLMSSTSTKNYILYQREMNGLKITLTKVITKNDNNVITTENKLNIQKNNNNNYADLGTKTVEFDAIDSQYQGKIGINILVCPKGKFHPYDFDNGVHKVIHSNFQDKGDWDLRCYDHSTGYFYVFYLLNNGKNFYYKYTGDIREKSDYIYSYLYDYRLQYDYQTNNRYKFCFLRFESFKLRLGSKGLEPNKGSYDGTGDVNMVSIGQDNDFTNIKNYTQAYFASDYNFYYFTYNNVNDYESGYSTNHVDFSDDDKYKSSVSNPGMVITKKSPLKFVDNVEIQEMKMIPESQYAYYKIYNKDKNTTYYGFLDIRNNKVLYNIEAQFKQFIPVSNNVMLAINDTSAYEICIIKSTSQDGDYCSDSCSSGNLFLNTNGNKC